MPTQRNAAQHMTSLLFRVDQWFARLAAWRVCLLSVLTVLLVFAADYATGYEIAMSIFYLPPVSAVAWYVGRRACTAMSLLAALCWLAADIAAGHPYAHPLIPIWNALVRLAFFLVTGLLLVAFRDGLFEARRLARTDGLTGVFGRRMFDERLEHDLELARRTHSPITVVFMDMDDFKRINDSFGHAVGDRVLCAVADALRSSTRRVDTVARLGGDEFALVLPETDPVAAREAATRLANAVANALHSAATGSTCSIGVVTFTGAPPLQPSEALNAADALMYDAKRQAKGQVLYRVITGAARDLDADSRLMPI